MADRLDRIYRLVPRLECKGLCADACGVIPMTPAEWERLSKPDAPHEEHEGLVYMPDVETARQDGMACPLLKDGRCTAYADRPLICRLWGAVETMPCPHGCRPKKYLRHTEGHTLLRMAQDG